MDSSFRSSSARLSREPSVSRQGPSKMATWLRNWMRHMRIGGRRQAAEDHQAGESLVTRSDSVTSTYSSSRRKSSVSYERHSGQPKVETEELTASIRSLMAENEELRAQMAELEAQRNMQYEVKRCFRDQAASLGEALRQCRQIAIDHGVDPRAVGVDVADPDSCDAGEGETDRLDAGHMDVEDSALPPRIVKLRRKAKKHGWFIEPSQVVLGDFIGEGTTANIYKAQWRSLDVAVKCILPHRIEETVDGVDKFCQEVELVARQRHPYVLRLLGASLQPPDYAWLVTEYLPGGTLMEWLHGDKAREGKRKVPLPPLYERLRVALEISQGMEYLQEQRPRILHRDLKPSNIFLDEHLHPRIADFGFGKMLQPPAAVLTGQTGTYIYMAPEVMKHAHYDEKCDVFSFGIMLCELVTGDRPYIETSYSAVQIATLVADGKLRPALPKVVVHAGLVELITSAWCQQPAKRPSFPHITSTLKDILQELPETEAPSCTSTGEQLTQIIHGLLGKRALSPLS